MVCFDTVYMAPRVRVALNSVLEPQYARKFWDLVDKLRSGRFDIKGLHVEKLHTRKGKVYSARLNVEIRVIFSMLTSGEKRSLVIWDANHHDVAYSKVDRMCLPVGLQEASGDLEPIEAWGTGSGRSLADLAGEAEQSDSEEMTDGLLLFEVPHYVLAEPGKYQLFERNIDRYLRLTDEQEELIKRHDKAYLVQGSAGTGKTTLALFHALNLYERNPDDDIFFFTYQDELACVCRCYKVNLVGEEENPDCPEDGGLRVFSYLEFCRHYLRRHLEDMHIDWQWISRDTSLEYLQAIINSKARWARAIQAEDTYSYIYSILKGRLVPGADRFPETDEDYQRIFKGYGTTPNNLEEIMEIFQLYETRLARSHKKDEADLIRYCYQNLKNTAMLSEEKRSTWIVIDEIQDFTELEWKSILLFWENKCKLSKTHLSFPFLSGDRNQNISRSGFRWQEVDSYVDAILKKMHRPSALVKAPLHKNFRNTLEIFNLGRFIRERAPESGGDIGTPPNFSGSLPTLIVGEQREFVDFLMGICAGEDQSLPAPLVVLFEDETDLKTIKRRLPLDDGLFLMPLRKSKGMEFEDCILYRLFASSKVIAEDTGVDLIARLFDLWYMAVTRARKNLVIYLTPDDWSAVERLFAGHEQELAQLVDLRRGDSGLALKEFFDRSEKYVPNYNVIFLERVKAQESWDEAQKEDAESLTEQERESRLVQALRLWKKCRDWRNLGNGYKSLGRYSDAIPYLKIANLPGAVAECFENVGDFEQAAHYYEENHALDDAARCYEHRGSYQKAAEMYELGQQWMKAGTNYERAEQNKKAAVCFEKAQNWEQAANLYCLRAEWLKAAEFYIKCQQFNLAAEMYLKVKDKLDAARCYSKAGDHQKAAKLLESLNRWSEAAESYEQAGMVEKAGPLYAKAGRLKDVACCAEKLGDWKLAASSYERMRNWLKAGEAYLSLGANDKAADCFDKGQEWANALPLFVELQDWLRAGRCCDRLGNLAPAIEYFVKAEAYNEAGHCYEKGQQWNQAADCYLKADNHAAAAEMLSRAHRRMDAARLYLLAGHTAPAMELARAIPPGDQSAAGKAGDLRLDLAVWAEQTNKMDIAGAVYEHMGQFMLAGARFKQAALPGKAAPCYERDRKFALAAELYLQAGDLGKAAVCYKAINQWQKAADCFERAREWDKARQMYERIGDHEGVRRCESSAQWL